MSKNEFKPNWELDQVSALSVQLSLSLHKLIPGWPGATDEQLAKLAEDIIAYFQDQLDGYRAGNKELAELVELERQRKIDWQNMANDRAKRIIELEGLVESLGFEKGRLADALKQATGDLSVMQLRLDAKRHT